LNDRARAVAPEKMGRNRLCQCEPPSEVVDAELAKPEDDRKVRKDPTGVWRWKQCGRCGSLRKKRWRETRRQRFSERDEYVSRVLANMMRDDEGEEDDGEAEDADADGDDPGTATAANPGGDDHDASALLAASRVKFAAEVRSAMQEVAASPGGPRAALAMLAGLEEDLKMRRRVALGGYRGGGGEEEGEQSVARG